MQGALRRNAGPARIQVTGRRLVNSICGRLMNTLLNVANNSTLVETLLQT